MRELNLQPLTAAARQQVWAQLPRDTVVEICAQMLAEADTKGRFDTTDEDVNRAWAERILNVPLRQRILVAVDFGSILIAPQLVLTAMREALQHCPPEPVITNSSLIDALVTCMLSIGDEIGAERSPQDVEWGGVDEALAADLIANVNFNRSLAFQHLLAYAERSFTSPWPDNTPPAALSQVGGSPAALFEEATGVSPDILHHAAVHLFVQYLAHGYLRFPDEFFAAIGLTGEQRSRLLKLITVDVDTMACHLGNTAAWDFNPLRRWPVVRLRDGHLLIVRVAWLLERVFGDLAYFDIRAYLKRCDEKNQTKRENAFRRCVQARLESEVGESLRRAFDKRGGQVWDEDDLSRAFSRLYPKGRPPKLCDFVVCVGNTWLVVDATERAISVSVAAGQVGAQALSAELDHVLTGRKGLQLESTISVLRQHMHVLTGRPVDDTARFIPLVATATGGLIWSLVVAEESLARFEKRGVLTQTDILPPALLSVRDLSLLEKEVESQGVRAVSRLVDWRSGDLSGLAFDQYLSVEGSKLKATRLEARAAKRMMTRAAMKLKARPSPSGAV